MQREPGLPEHKSEGADLTRLLEHAGAERPLFEFLAYTGLRVGEALELRWCDVDFEAGVLHVRQQLSRHRTLKLLKTDAARREVVLAPAVTRLLRERWLVSSHKEAEHLVFCRLSLHSLRHWLASLLIAKGLNVVFISRQLGHASPAITLEVYAHLFEQVDHAATAREALEASYAAMMGTSGL